MTRDNGISLFAVALAIGVLMLFCAPAAHCQLPDAPSALSQATATSQCWRGAYNADGSFATVPVDCDKLPPSWRAFNAPRARRAGYWSFRRADEPYLRTNRETLRSKIFWLPVAGAALATTGDVLAQRHNLHHQNPPLPAGSELYVDAYVPFGACLALDYVADRFFGRPIGTAVMAFVAGKHVHGAVSGRYP